MAGIEVSAGGDAAHLPSGGRDGADEIFRHRLAQEVFEERAAATPGAIAVDGPRGTLTYGELNERANRLARLLRARGAGPEVVAGLCLPRGADLVVALLATVKAGGAWAQERYDLRRYAGDIVLFLKDSPDEPAAAKLEAWRAHVSGDLVAYAAEATHHTILLDRHARALAKALSSYLRGEPASSELLRPIGRDPEDT